MNKKVEKNKQKILIVDDDISILDALTLILEEEGYLIETTEKGEETFGKLNSFQPDIILLDILMSGKDGREICKKIKENKDTANIPVILLSAHPTAAKSYKDFGAEEFLPKPFEANELMRIIEKYIN